MNRMKAVVFAVTLVFLASMLSPPQARADVDVSFGFFYSNLSPHGSWLVSAEYGRVWQPGVYASGWNPYYDGHWVYTDLGWTWVSDYRWGAIPYHYGTWVADSDLGWVWVPGYVWAPAWVVFRTGPDYIGWAPCSPNFSIGISASYGAPVGGSFLFVSAGDFLAPRIRTAIVPASRTTVIINNTKIVNNLVVENNVVVNRGPDVRLIERASGRQVREVSIARVSGVAPGGRVTKADLRVDRQETRGGLRAAEPVSVKEPLPVAGRNESRIGKREESASQRGIETKTRDRNTREKRSALETRQTETDKRRATRQAQMGQELSSPRSERDPGWQRGTAPSNRAAESYSSRPRPREEARTSERSVRSRDRETSRSEAPSVTRPSRTTPPDSGSVKSRRSSEPEQSVRRPSRTTSPDSGSVNSRKPTEREQSVRQPRSAPETSKDAPPPRKQKAKENRKEKDTGKEER